MGSEREKDRKRREKRKMRKIDSRERKEVIVRKEIERESGEGRGKRGVREEGTCVNSMR